MSEKEVTSDTETKKVEKREFRELFTIEDLTINIPSEEKRSRYWVGDFSFDCENQKTVDALTERTVQIKDIVVRTVMSKKIEQLLNNDFIEDTLKTELRDKVNEVLMEGSVLSVYLSERIIN